MRLNFLNVLLFLIIAGLLAYILIGETAPYFPQNTKYIDSLHFANKGLEIEKNKLNDSLLIYKSRLKKIDSILQHEIQSTDSIISDSAALEYLTGKLSD